MELQSPRWPSRHCTDRANSTASHSYIFLNSKLAAAIGLSRRIPEKLACQELVCARGLMCGSGSSGDRNDRQGKGIKSLSFIPRRSEILLNLIHLELTLINKRKIMNCAQECVSCYNPSICRGQSKELLWFQSLGYKVRSCPIEQGLQTAWHARTNHVSMEHTHTFPTNKQRDDP